MQLIENIRTTPFFRFFLPFVAGILFQLNVSFTFNYLYLVIFLFLIFSIIFFYKKIVENRRLRWIFGILLNLLLFFVGSYLVQFYKVNIPQVSLNQNITFTSQVVESVDEKAKTYKTLLKLKSIIDSTNSQTISGQMLVYLQKDSFSAKLKYGDIIVCQSKINEIKNLNNPKEFDFKQYLQDRDITVQTYLQSNKWNIIGNSKPNIIKYYAIESRTKLLNIYKKYGIKDKEFAVLAALTLGYTNDIDDETKQAFSTTGAMHILSVSGLHVAVVFMILNYALFFMDKNKKLKIIKFIIIILSLWAFAYISGFAPSVRRSAIMLSLVLVGDIFNKDKNIYNTITVSAFLLLFFNPFVIRDVGFQLSYIAVVSIIYFQPKIHKLVYVKNYLGKQIWSLFSVALAAQLGTLPIGIYYFHQFSNYFFITNILAVPLSTLILYLAVGLLAISFINPLAQAVAWVLNYSTKLFNFIIFFINKMPFSVTSNLYINFWQMIILYILMATITVFLISKQKNYLFASLVITICFSITLTFQNIKSLEQNTFTVYNIKNSAAINLISSKSNYLFTDTILENNEKNINLMIGSNWISKKVPNYDVYKIDRILFQNIFFPNNSAFLQNKEFFIFCDKKILVMRDKTMAENFGDTTLTLDYIILSQNVYVNIDDLTKNFKFKQIIFDSSNKANRIERWKEECEKLGVNYFSVPDSGAFVLDL